MLDFLAAAIDPDIKHHLSVITFLPLVGALFLAFINRKRERELKATAFFFSLITFIASLPVLFDFNVGAGYDKRLMETAEWIPAFGIQYKMGVDGISLFLVMLTTFLAPIIMLSSSTTVHSKVKEYFIAMLVLETGLIGSFCALDLFLFYVFFELMLIPMYLLIGVWGSDESARRAAAIKFFVYTLVGSLLMFLAVLYIAGVAKTFDMERLPEACAQLPMTAQYLCFGAFMLSFAIKTPLFPFHTWLPHAHTEAPTGGSVALAGMMLKLGTYGMIRFAIPFFPVVAYDMAPLIMTLSVIGIIYGSMMCLAQDDLKRLIAYSSVAHMGFIVLGLFSFNFMATQGALLQNINHGLSTGLLFLCVGMLYERRHTRIFAEFGGIAKVMPKFAVLFMIATLASIGLPGTNGFVGEFLILMGTFGGVPDGQWTWTLNSTMALLAATGVVLGAVYMLWAYQRVFFGEITVKENLGLRDVNRTELAFSVPVVVMIFFIGLNPNFLLARSEPAVQATLQRTLAAVAEHRAAQAAAK
ncbi:MAG: NADH-quinone oxidoreductase subunit M [Planctomycetes bacterium]|nr:NADH-quinone oxidoreductase subunit M [Planctomycetota bacterium]MCQ3951391.1 Fe-S-binding domain-containing protein [Planctomycetota bacterium]GIK54080.1 MAG: NADH:ubiquinone oxidoreductase subunit M [Planctomycetota bacterium]